MFEGLLLGILGMTLLNFFWGYKLEQKAEEIIRLKKEKEKAERCIQAFSDENAFLTTERLRLNRQMKKRLESRNRIHRRAQKAESELYRQQRFEKKYKDAMVDLWAAKGRNESMNKYSRILADEAAKFHMYAKDLADYGCILNDGGKL